MIVLDGYDTVPLSEFVPEVRVSVGDVPQEVAESYIRQSAIDLAVRSQVLVRRVDIPLQECVTEYLAEVPSGERIVSVQRIGGFGDDNGCGIGDKSRKPGHQTAIHCGSSQAYFEYPDRFHIDVLPRAHTGMGFWMRVAVAPIRDACSIDRRFYEDYHEAVIHGALARLFLLRATPWFDPSLAKYHEIEAGQRITAAGVDRLTGGSRGPFKMRSRRVV